MKQYLICAPTYSELNGGVIALHKLCHLLNQEGHVAYLFPYVDNYQLHRFSYRSVLPVFLKKELRRPFRSYKTNPALNTPYLTTPPADIQTNPNWVVVYPEIAFGNPLGGKNVVRWLLNNPTYNSETGKFDKLICFGAGELYFRFGPWFKTFSYPGSHTSEHCLHVVHYPLDLYNQTNCASQRVGTAYCQLKGRHKKIVHDLSDSILVDGMKHREMAAIFKRVQTFISYDSYTTLSLFAALCGCDSVIIPDAGVSEDQWMPNTSDRYGLAYGFENIPKARASYDQLVSNVRNLENVSVNSVKHFITEVEHYFPGSANHRHLS